LSRPCLANLRYSARITKILLLCIEQIRRGEARLVAKTVLSHLLDPKDMTRIRCSRRKRPAIPTGGVSGLGVTLGHGFYEGEDTANGSGEAPDRRVDASAGDECGAGGSGGRG